VTEHNCASFPERFSLLCLDQGAAESRGWFAFHRLITELRLMWLAVQKEKK
jgi:hypothetical protein